MNAKPTSRINLPSSCASPAPSPVCSQGAGCAAPRSSTTARPASLPDDPTLYGRPTARELLDAVADFLTDDVAASNDPHLAYQGRVAANVVRMVERELAHPATRRTGDGWTTLALDVRDRLAVANPRHLSR